MTAVPHPPLRSFPFTALVGQETMKLALVLNAIHPAIGGVLIRGEKGTAKSTAVRALARLLPELEVVADCVYGCPPDEEAVQCAECRGRRRAGEELPRARRRMRVVELPINASEDRVVGTIDIEAAIQKGEKKFEPGVLAEANRNILYVDEVNLLDDHLVDVLLDAAAMGVNVVEREGISVWHPSRFILVGTMNPEEGELRPQLLDRFGLCVDVSGLRSLEERVAVLERDLQRADAGDGLGAKWAAAELQLHRTLARAAGVLSRVVVPRDVLRFAAALCVEAGVVGHRADLVVIRAARALRAVEEARSPSSPAQGDGLGDPPRVTLEDVLRAAELALAHRRRDRRQGAEPAAAGSADPGGEPAGAPAVPAPESGAMPRERTSEGTPSDDGGHRGQGSVEQSPQRARAQDAAPGTAEGSEYGGSLFAVRRLQLPRDRRMRRTAGKRSLSRSGDKRGRYVRATTVERTTDVAFDATLRAAAPHQRRRRQERPVEDGPVLRLQPQDLRQKVRQRRTGTLIVFVVDASASMDAEQRMQATKGAVLSLLRDAYVRRDKVALIVFNGRTARAALRPTSSIDLAERRLQRLSVGGTTPLTHGLVAALELIRTERWRDPDVYPLLVLISDGRGNISLFGDEPLVEAQRVAARIRAEGIRSLVIDSARDYTQRLQLPRIGARSPQPIFGGYAFNACLDLAERMGGTYFGLYDLSQGAILAGVRRSLREEQ